ncbi:hypothetical protein [Helicobacter pametensis]|uniref:hypothetical protein n=1 Tax=Helicobacter pametensis TaxID=95149 RepID=UPI000480E98A|nr:hypothetical protein [Helicobacter pametensis]
MCYIDENGEVFSREDLIKKITSLLNRIDSQQESILCVDVMESLEISDLGAIYKGLLKKEGKEIEQNQEWLLGLARL